jgi:hypothetical protein
LVTDQALLIESSASAVISCAECFVVNRTCHARNAHPCITRPLLPMCVVYCFSTTRATVVADTGSSFLHSFSRSYHAPHQPHSLALRLVASSSTPRASPSQREVSQERESYPLLIARHLSCILTLPTARTEPPCTTTTSFDVRHAVRASLLTVLLLRMTRTAHHCHTHSYIALLVYTRAPLARSIPAHRARRRGHAHAISRKLYCHGANYQTAASHRHVIHTCSISTGAGSHN